MGDLAQFWDLILLVLISLHQEGHIQQSVYFCHLKVFLKGIFFFKTWLII